MKIKIIILILVSVITGCRILHKDYRNKDYYKLDRGTLSFVGSLPIDSLINENNDNCQQDDTCFLFKIIESLDSVKRNERLGIILQLDAKYFTRKWTGAVPDGSIEKISELTFYFRKGKKKYIISNYNIRNPTKITCSDYVDGNGRFLLNTENQNWQALQNKKPFPHHQFPIYTIDGFIDFFNANSAKLESIDNFQFHFIFDSTLFDNLDFDPEILTVEMVLKLPTKKRERFLRINRNVHLSNILIL